MEDQNIVQRRDVVRIVEPVVAQQRSHLRSVFLFDMRAVVFLVGPRPGLWDHHVPFPEMADQVVIQELGPVVGVDALDRNAPGLGADVFLGAYLATVYYLPDTTGWPLPPGTFGDRPAVLWNPQALNDASFGMASNGFGFTITGSSNLVIVVEACTNLVHPAWTPVGTNTLTGGTSCFSDPSWTNDPSRFYRLRGL